MAAPDPVIEVASLAKRYGRRGPEAVRGVSFEVPRGQVFGLIGPDGAGKTSIIQILAGVLRPDSGAARVAGLDVRARPERVKAVIGYMPQGLGLNLYDKLTVAENIDFFRDLRGIPEAHFRDNRDRLLAMTRLAPFLDRPAGNLSGGMRQKLALICTLVHLPDILLLDEPTTGVDPISRREFWAIIHDLVATRGVSVLMSTAYMDEAERCHAVGLMHGGEILDRGAPDALVRSVGGRVAAVEGAAPEKVLAALADWPAAVDVTVIGGRVKVLVRDGGADLSARLAEAGMDAAGVAETPPGLEDLFVQRIAGAAPAEDGAGRSAPSHRGGAERLHEARNAWTAEDGFVAADGLTCRFGDFTAVDSVSLRLERGEILGLLGPNGAGKTTLIKMLCGLQRPSAGGGRVAGADCTGPRAALSPRIGYMSQRFSLYGDMTVEANLRLYAGLYGLDRARRDRRIGFLLDALDLAPYRRRLGRALPLGIRQRLALACANLHEPPVLILDEPTSSVDPLARRTFWNIVHLLASEAGVAVLVSTHYMDEAEHCDRLGFMQAGRLVAIDAPDDLRRQATERAGPLVAVEAADFAAAFLRLRAVFPRAMLYGRRIEWQSRAPDADRAKAASLLAEAGIAAETGIRELSMEETFVNFLESGGGADA